MRILETEFRHTDPRRTLNQLLTADIKQINLYEAQEGSILGDHFHKQTTEYFYLLQGTVIYNNQMTIDEGTMFVVYPEENHTLTCLTYVKLMSFLTKPYSEDDPDIWKK